MRLGWFNDGECLTALGDEYNYCITTELRGKKRICRIEQSWYRPDLDDVLILKITWMPTTEEAQQLCQAWENAYGKIHIMDRSRMGRMKAAAKATRERRRALRERAHDHQ